MTSNNILVIGANGGIAQGIIELWAKTNATLWLVSRSPLTSAYENVHTATIDTSNEDDIAHFCQTLVSQSVRISHVFCCIGVLHCDNEGNGVALLPEKKLEDISTDAMAHYFAVNSVVPLLWLKHSQALLKQDNVAHFVALSARVGSISDNRLGGWYGYRASKAALNMLLKSAHVELQRRANNICLTCYHPGTVDTKLSAPFQANVKDDKLFTAEFTANQLLNILPGLLPENGPHYVDWQGKPIAW